MSLRLFAEQPAKEKRSPLNFLLSNSTRAAATLTVEFKEPFDVLAETLLAADRVEDAEGTDSARKAIWLGDLDSNQGCPGQSREFYR